MAFERTIRGVNVDPRHAAELSIDLDRGYHVDPRYVRRGFDWKQYEKELARPRVQRILAAEQAGRVATQSVLHETPSPTPDVPDNPVMEERELVTA